MLIAVPLTTWSALKRIVASAWIEATAMPATIAAAIAIQGLPVKWFTAAAANAPASISPSSAMLITPERSENIPPSAASRSGVASRIVEKTIATLKISSIRPSPPPARNARTGTGTPIPRPRTG